MAGVSITSRSHGQIPPRSLVFPDGLNVRVSAFVAEARLLELNRFAGKYDREGEVFAESATFHNLYVHNGRSGALISGSLRTWADRAGVVSVEDPFGPDEVALALDALGEELGFPAGVLHEGRVTKLEYAADLVLPHPARHYVGAALDISRRDPAWRFGDSTVTYQGTEDEVKLYGKVEELRAKGKPVPRKYAGAHVLRVEHTVYRGGVPAHFREPEGGVRARHLADGAFRDDLARRWAEVARSVPFRRIARPSLPLEKASRRIKWYALRGIEAEGGLDAVRRSIRADHEAGRLPKGRLESHLKSVNALARDPRYAVGSVLADEFRAAVEAVAQDGVL